MLFMLLSIDAVDDAGVTMHGRRSRRRGGRRNTSSSSSCSSSGGGDGGVDGGRGVLLCLLQLFFPLHLQEACHIVRSPFFFQSCLFDL